MKQLRFFTGIALVLLLVSCGKPQPPQYAGYQNFRIEKASFNNSVLASDIKLYNPNAYNLNLKSASLDVYFNDKFLGHSSLDSLIVLPAKDTAVFPLRMTASAKDILSNSAKLLLNPDVKIRITGSAKAGRGGFYINVPINYEGTQRIDLRELISSYKNEARESKTR
jgi:LEA14-like dessication related protein